MGMSTHVVGFRPPDEKWKQMKAIWDSCAQAKITPPEEVQRFFNWTSPDESGVEMKLTGGVIAGAPAVREWNDDMREGYEIDLEALRKHHPDVTKLRFWNSY